MNGIAYDKLIKFIRNEINDYTININRSTKIEEDLWITGDDIYEFFERFSKEFCVDISELDLSKYFKGEGSNPLLDAIKKMITNRKQLTIGDLEIAIKKGKLI